MTFDFPARAIHLTLTALQTVTTQPPELPNSLWLPTEVDVHLELDQHYGYPWGDILDVQQWVRTNHRFTDYQPYRVPEGRTATLEAGRTADVFERSPYLKESLKELTKRIPDLKGIRPARDQQALPAILRNTGERVDEFFDNIVDVIPNEQITQERRNSFVAASRCQRFRQVQQV